MGNATGGGSLNQSGSSVPASPVAEAGCVPDVEQAASITALNRSSLLSKWRYSVLIDTPASFNSSDFQKGGFTNAECIELVKKLNDSTLDLLELSGGSLEQPKIAGLTLMDEGEDAPRESTVRREAFFVDFAAAVRAAAKMPVMVVGGFRTTAAMIESLERGELDIIGLGRPVIADPEVPKRILSGEVDRATSPEAALHPFHLLPWNNMQLERLADGLEPDLSLDGTDAVAQFTELETCNMSALLQHRS
jgi:hypothetical protein